MRRRVSTQRRAAWKKIEPVTVEAFLLTRRARPEHDLEHLADVVRLLDEGFGTAIGSFLNIPVPRITAGYDNPGCWIDLQELLKALLS